MKKTIQTLAILLILVVPSFATDSKEQQCAESVEATISAIELTSKIKGTEEKLEDLSIQDIRQMQKEKGSCETMKEIKKRTMK